MIMVKKWSKSLLSIMMGGVILLCLCSNFYVSAAEKSVYLSDMDWVSWKLYEGNSSNPDSKNNLGVNETQGGECITIAGVTYDKGLSFHPSPNEPGEVVYNIDGLGYKTFSAIVGKDLAAASVVGEDALKDTCVQFYVLVDDVVKADSNILKYGETYNFLVDITGGSKLTLRITDGGDGIFCDASSWGNPILSSGNTDEVIVTPLPTEKLSSPSPTQALVTENHKTSTPNIATPKTTSTIQPKTTNSTGTIITIVVAGLIVSAVVIGLIVMTKAKKNKD